MDATAFFEEPEAKRILDRAARAAALPLSLHRIDEGNEGERLAGWGGCDACRHVRALPWGRQSCRRSREAAAEDALRRNLPIPFLCHMRFSCVSVPALIEQDSGYVMTFGPFCPTEAPDSLEDDALECLHALEREPSEELPFTLSDIPAVSAEAVPAIAEWAAEALAALRDSLDEAHKEKNAPQDPAPKAIPSYESRHPARPVRDAYQGADIAAALGGGDQDRARALVKGMISDTSGGKRLSMPVRRARSVALAAAVLENAERAGLRTAASWDRFPDLHRAVREARNEGELSAAVMRVVGALKRGNRDAASGSYPYEELNRVVIENIADGITLNDVASVLGQTPSAITRRLQRKFGLSYTEYMGRIRVDLAKDLLRDTKLPVKDIARRVGLNDAGNFSKLFRRHEGQTPTQFRKLFGRKR